MKQVRRDLPVAVLLTLLGCLLFLGSPRAAVAEQRVSVAQARARLSRHITHISERRDQMTKAYYYSGAVKTVETAFKEHGISASLSNADSWGKMGIGLTWSESARQFYDYHRDALTQSLSVIEQRGYATESEMANLDRGMQSWDQYDQNIETQFRAMVDSFTEEAKVTDEKDDYLKKYNARLRELESKRPYPSDDISALNSEMTSKTKALDERIKQIDRGNLKKATDNIQETAGKHLFSALTKVPGSSTSGTTTTGEDSPVIVDPEKPKPTTHTGPVLPPPSIPDVLRRSCEAKNPEGMKQLDAEEKELDRLLEQARYFNDEAAIARKHALEYRDLARQADSSASNFARKGDEKNTQKARKEAQDHRADAAARAAEASKDQQKANDFERRADAQLTRVRELTVKVLKDCQK